MENKSTEEPDLGAFSDELNEKIMAFLHSNEVVNALKEVKAEEGITTILPTGNLFTDYETLNEVHIGVYINDQSHAVVEAFYVCVPEDRSQSNLVIEMDIPRNYETMDEFKEWAEIELAEVLSHELQHSCDSTEMLTGDIPEGEEKWASLENIEKHFASVAETRGWIAGILGRSRRSGISPEDILDDKLGQIFNQALDKGYDKEEMTPIMQRIYQKWMSHLSGV